MTIHGYRSGGTTGSPPTILGCMEFIVSFAVPFLALYGTGSIADYVPGNSALPARLCRSQAKACVAVGFFCFAGSIPCFQRRIRKATSPPLVRRPRTRLIPTELANVHVDNL